MRWLNKDEVRAYLRNHGVTSGAKTEEIMSGFDFDQPLYEQPLEEGQALYQFVRMPSFYGAGGMGNWFALPSASMDGLAIFGGLSGRHPHKFQVTHSFVALEGTAAKLPKDWGWGGGGFGGATQLYVPPRLLGHVTSVGPL